MNIGLERCISFINTNLGEVGKHSHLGQGARLEWFITISRQAGCNAHGTAEKLAAMLQAQTRGGGPAWTVFDKNLVERVLEDHHLPTQLREHMPEDRSHALSDIIEEVFDLHPSAWSLVQKAGDTMLRLADRGRCILIGRGANFVTRKLDRGFHVRLVGALEKRIERMEKYEKISPAEARKRVRDQDRARARYVKKYFEADIEDAAHYDLALNVDCFDAEAAAKVITQALLARIAAQ